MLCAGYIMNGCCSDDGFEYSASGLERKAIPPTVNDFIFLDVLAKLDKNVSGSNTSRMSQP
jgi:hypothetical protein